ncbi:MAG: universal stress protein [Bacteroidales bacterium]|nr:MAG: universal stress protein [Bacteroidales bacterium]
MTKTNNILVPVDFREESLSALRFAVKIAQSIEGKIVMLYVIEEQGFFTNIVLSEEQREMIHKSAADKLKALKKEEKSLEKIPVETVVKKGKVYSQIVDTSIEINAKLIIMGRTDSSDWKKNFTGTNTLHIIRESEIPVITVRNDRHLLDDHILLPLNLRSSIKEKVGKAIEVAHLLKARISILTVLDTDLVSIELKVNNRLYELKKIFNKYNIECTTNLIESREDISKIINSYSKEINADIIMIMTQQELDFHDYIIGTTAQEIINNSELPVISIIPNTEIEEEIDMSFIKHLVDPLGVYKTDK